jgi:hypothetical protein
MSFKMYAITRNIGSQSQSSGYLNSPVTGPLNSSQFPNSMPYHSYGMLNGIRPTPPQFFPSQTPLNSDMNVNARRQYKSATSASNQLTQQQYPKPSHMNYIKPMDGSSRVDILKSRAIGKSSYKVGLPNDAFISTKNYDNNCVRSSLRKSRSGGTVAPKKKGSIYNPNST